MHGAGRLSDHPGPERAGSGLGPRTDGPAAAAASAQDNHRTPVHLPYLVDHHHTTTSPSSTTTTTSSSGASTTTTTAPINPLAYMYPLLYAGPVVERLLDSATAAIVQTHVATRGHG